MWCFKLDIIDQQSMLSKGEQDCQDVAVLYIKMESFQEAMARLSVVRTILISVVSAFVTPH